MITRQWKTVMLSRAIFVAIAWICLIGAVTAQTLSFPALTGRVVDEAGVLDTTTRAALMETLADFESKTTDQLVVVTLNSLQGTSIEDYGYQLGRRWQIGQKDKNNGVLLIVVPTERKVRIDVGYGLEGTLTDAISKFIIENSILPRFKRDDFEGGIRRGVEDIIQVLSGDAEEWQLRAAKSLVTENTRPAAKDPILPTIIIVLVGAGVLIVCATMGGAACRTILQLLFLMLLSGRGKSSGGKSSWSGGGGSFGGGGASGGW